MKITGARDFFTRLPRSLVTSYSDYWRGVSPGNVDDVFRRWLFAFCSVHTSWQGNVRGYTGVRDFSEWLGNKRKLTRLLEKSRTGMHNMKANFIHAFARKFWDEPDKFAEWERRDELVETVTGLGTAKVSFALNMIRPLDSRVICFDVHMLRLYGLEELNYKTSKGLRLYKRAERDWLDRCEETPPYVAHSIYWDALHGQTSPDYWGYVLR